MNWNYFVNPDEECQKKLEKNINRIDKEWSCFFKIPHCHPDSKDIEKAKNWNLLRERKKMRVLKFDEECTNYGRYFISEFDSDFLYAYWVPNNFKNLIKKFHKGKLFY